MDSLGSSAVFSFRTDSLTSQTQDLDASRAVLKQKIDEITPLSDDECDMIDAPSPEEIDLETQQRQPKDSVIEKIARQIITVFFAKKEKVLDDSLDDETDPACSIFPEDVFDEKLGENVLRESPKEALSFLSDDPECVQKEELSILSFGKNYRDKYYFEDTEDLYIEARTGNSQVIPLQEAARRAIYNTAQITCASAAKLACVGQKLGKKIYHKGQKIAPPLVQAAKTKFRISKNIFVEVVTSSRSLKIINSVQESAKKGFEFFMDAGNVVEDRIVRVCAQNNIDEKEGKVLAKLCALVAQGVILTLVF